VRECQCRFTRTQQRAYAIGYGIELRDFLDYCIALVKAGKIPEAKQPELLRDVRKLAAEYRKLYAEYIR
jgi:hypothetical protein